MTDEEQNMADEEAQEAEEQEAEDQEQTARQIEQLLSDEITLRELEGISEEEYHSIAAIGHSLLDQGKIEQARTIYEGLVAIDPNHAYVHTTLGSILLRENEPVDALGRFNEALRLDPEDTYALVNRGEMKLSGGLLEEAAADFKTCIELDPDGKDPAAMRARALVTVVRDLLAKAAEAARGKQSGEETEAQAAT